MTFQSRLITRPPRRAGSAPFLPALARGQRDQQAGAGLAVVAILGADRPAMPFDDGPRDREAEAAVAAERLARRAFAVKAAEDRVALRRFDPRAIVVDLHMHLVAEPGRRHADKPVGGREADRIVDD